MPSIDKFLMEYLGEFTPIFLERENGTYMFLDMLWIFKAILLTICLVFALKYIFRILQFLITWR